MALHKLLFVALLLTITSPAFATIWYVDRSTTGPHDGTTWATAYSTIQPAIWAASNAGGGEVWVAAGRYGESTARDSAIVLQANVALYGGFDGTETERTQRDWDANPTVIDASTTRFGSPSYHVLEMRDGSRVDGFELTGGRATGGNSASALGGGIYVSNATVTVANCRITDNYGEDSGGGLYATTSTVTLENCTFEDNRTADGGGGVRASTTELSVTECAFIDNSAREGGAIFSNGKVTLVGSTFTGNGSTDSGGAILLADGASIESKSISGCYFNRNHAGGWGGAVYAGQGQPCPITNSVFTGNSAVGYGGCIVLGAHNIQFSHLTMIDNSAHRGEAIYLRSAEGTKVDHCIVTSSQVPSIDVGLHSELLISNSVAVIGTSQGGTVASSTNVIATAPTFVDRANGDLRLMPSSVGIDAGPLAPGAPTVDILGVTRPFGAGADMGAYEFTAVDDSDGDGLPDAYEGTEDPDDDTLPNSQDLDSDDDGIPDALEGLVDSDRDGTRDFTDTDSDDNGIPDATEGADDPDEDGIPNNADPDNDDDGILDATDGTDDVDSDGTPNYLDEDSDGDTIRDSVEGTGDRDDDGILNFLDTDSDGDGVPDQTERANGWKPYDADTDDDGVKDGEEVDRGMNPADSDSEDDGLLDGFEVAHGLDPLRDDAEEDPDRDGVSNLDEMRLAWDPRDASSPPSTVYVSAEIGSDTQGTGAEDSPWRTIDFAMRNITNDVPDTSKVPAPYTLATETHPVTLALDAGVYAEQVALLSHVRIHGLGPGQTIIQHYAEEDDEHVVVYAAEGAGLRDCTITVPGVVATPVTLASITDVSMELSGVALDGLSNPFSIGVLVSGAASSRSSVRGSSLQNLNDGVWAVESGIAIGQNLFDNIQRHAVFAQASSKSDTEPLVPHLGGLDNGGLPGYNRFGNVFGDAVHNESPSQVLAQWNDWGVYSSGAIAERVYGDVAFEPFLGAPIGETGLMVQVRDGTTESELDERVAPRVSASGITFDLIRPGLHYATNPVPGTATVTVGAYGYVSQKVAVDIKPGPVTTLIVGLFMPAELFDTDVDDNGETNILDLRACIEAVLAGSPTPPELMHADVDGNGKVNILDLQFIITAILASI